MLLTCLGLSFNWPMATQNEETEEGNHKQVNAKLERPICEPLFDQPASKFSASAAIILFVDNELF